MNIYLLTQSQQSLNAMLEANGGELTPEIEAALVMNRENYNAVAPDMAKSILHYKAIEEACKAEIDRITGIRRTAARAQESYKRVLLDAYNEFGEPEGMTTIKFRKGSSTHAVIDDETKLPSRFTIVKTEIDKAKLLAELRSGAHIGGAHIEKTTYLSVGNVKAKEGE